MSHFLARLASSITQSPHAMGMPKLRPLAGSIYEPLGFRSENAPGTPIEAEASEPRRLQTPDAHGFRAIMRMETAQRAGKSGNDESVFQHSTRAGAKDAPQSQTMQQHEALLPPSQDAESLPPSSFAHAVPVPHRQDAVSAAQMGLGDILPVEEQPLARRSQPLQKNANLPLLPQAMIQPARSIKHDADKDSARRAVPQAQEPDEIHIHIGRVEVAAVMQPAVRPAPAAQARKAMSLDEYLRRSNGRAR